MHTPTPAEAAERIRSQTAVNLITAAAALDVSPATASRAIAAGRFPVPIIRMGSRVIVPTPALRELLGISASGAA